MDCNIHLFRERLVEDSWTCIDEFIIDEDGNTGQLSSCYRLKNPQLFGILASVQEQFPYALSPRGAPEDCSGEVWDEITQWSVQGHSHSWLCLHELSGLYGFLEMKRRSGAFIGDLGIDKTLEDLNSIVQSFAGLPNDLLDRYRIVFFFDTDN